MTKPGSEFAERVWRWRLRIAEAEGDGLAISHCERALRAGWVPYARALEFAKRSWACTRDGEVAEARRWRISFDQTTKLPSDYGTPSHPSNPPIVEQRRSP